MAWTAPRTWVASEVVTAALLNTHIRDNQLAIDALLAIATAPATGRVPVGDGTDFQTHAHLFVTSGSLLVRHEVGGLEADISAITKGGLISASGAGAVALLGVGSNGQTLVADSAEVTGLKWAAGLTKSTSLSGSRTGVAGAGTQAVTGAGFAPTTVIIIASNSSGGDGGWSIGWGDDAAGEAAGYLDDHVNAGVADLTRGNTSSSQAVSIQDSATSTITMTAVIASMDADGFTLTWSENGGAFVNDVNWVALCIGG